MAGKNTQRLSDHSSNNDQNQFSQLGQASVVRSHDIYKYTAHTLSYQKSSVKYNNLTWVCSHDTRHKHISPSQYSNTTMAVHYHFLLSRDDIKVGPRPLDQQKVMDDRMFPYNWAFNAIVGIRLCSKVYNPTAFRQTTVIIELV